MSRRPTDPARDHRVFDELAVGYAVHALEPEDELSFTAHLARCQHCAQMVDSYRQALGTVASSVPPVEPPPTVLQGIRARLGDTGPAAPATGAPTARVELPAPRRPLVQVRRTWLLATAAGVVVVLVALAGYSVVLRGDRNAATQRGDRLAAAVRTLERPGAQTVRLAGFDGQVRVVAVASGNTMSLVVDGLPPNDDQTTYVLWGQTRAGAVRALSAFDVRRSEVDVVGAMPLATPMADLTALMVTREKGRTAPPQAREPVLAAGNV